MKKTVILKDIESNIYSIRGKRVMMDRDLAELYGVEVKYLKRQVRRNLDRFPLDFMFQLSKQEFINWRCQSVTSNSADKMGLRYSPYAFTEQGVAMLSSVLNSERSILVNIQIMRVFVDLRRAALTYVSLNRKINSMEKKYYSQFKVIFEAIKRLITPEPQKSKRTIGFHRN